MGTGTEHGLEGYNIAAKVGDQDLDRGLGHFVLNGGYALGKLAGSPVL
jgi:hypothetical protein